MGRIDARWHEGWDRDRGRDQIGFRQNENKFLRSKRRLQDGGEKCWREATKFQSIVSEKEKKTQIRKKKVKKKSVTGFIYNAHSSQHRRVQQKWEITPWSFISDYNSWRQLDMKKKKKKKTNRPFLSVAEYKMEGDKNFPLFLCI